MSNINAHNCPSMAKLSARLQADEGRKAQPPFTGWRCAAAFALCLVIPPQDTCLHY